MKLILLKLAILIIGLNCSVYAKDFSLMSDSIKPNSSLTNKQVFNGFGCSGDNVSPALSWKNSPKGTKSFAITMYDPDAPTGSGWWHWVVYNIPPSVNHLVENAGDSNSKGLPIGSIQGRTDFGSVGFGGACPPVGDKPHRYQFTIYALNVERIAVPENASPALIGYMIHMNSLGSSKLQAKYGR